MADETNGTEKRTELTSISIILHEEYDGPRVMRDVRCGDGKNKFSVSIPSPRTNEEAKELYNIDLNFLIDKGVKQHSYDADTDAGNLITEKIKAGIDPNDFADDVKASLEEEMFWTEKETKASQTKITKAKAAKADQAEKKTGFSMDDQLAIFSYAQAQNCTLAEAIAALKADGKITPLAG